VERRVEDGELRDVRPPPPRVVDRSECGAVVQRRELRELLQRGTYVVVDENRILEAHPSVHDAMCDGVHVARLLERVDSHR
jgi:hypothetical protein